MKSVLARKPLTDGEKAEPACTVCVTGAAGFIASQIVCRLLAAGHTVHATYRERDDPATLSTLKALPGAQERMIWYNAELLVDGSFDEAVQGCKYVLHTAAPVSMSGDSVEAFSRIADPAVRGALNVLSSVNRAPSVERMVMTSSFTAMVGGPHHADVNHVVTEEDWNVSFGSQRLPYFMAKTVSEWEAWAICAQQDRWSLVTICPANVVGPPLAAIRGSEAVETARKLLNGSTYPFAPPVDLPVVDVADVAAAHCIAMVTKSARGRYLVCERGALLTEVAAILRRQFPTFWVPHVEPPFWLAALLFKLTGILSVNWLKETYGRKTLFSSAKALRELPGLAPFIPLEQTLEDTGRALSRLGLLPKIPDTSSAASKEE